MATTWRFINYNSFREHPKGYRDSEIRFDIQIVKETKGRSGACNPNIVSSIVEGWYKDHVTLTIRYKDGGIVQRIWKRA